MSDHEQQVLEEIEKQFYEQDPKGARELAGQTPGARLVRNFRRGLVGFILGFIVLGLFFLRPDPLVGVVAFLMMLGGATYAYQNLRKAGFGGGIDASGRVSKMLGSFEERLRSIRRRKD